MNHRSTGRGRLAEQGTEPAQRTEVAHARRGLAQAERARRLAVRELLEVAEQDDLAVAVVELHERRLEPPLELAAEGRGRGCQLRVAELRGQVERRAVEKRGRRQRLFAVQAAPRGAAVPPVLVDHRVARDLADPEVERHRRVAQVLIQPLARLDQDVLDDVTGIDPAPQRAIEAELDHPPQRCAIRLPEPLRRPSRRLPRRARAAPGSRLRRATSRRV